jgi:hypothetical protein
MAGRGGLTGMDTTSQAPPRLRPATRAGSPEPRRARKPADGRARAGSQDARGQDARGQDQRRRVTGAGADRAAGGRVAGYRAAGDTARGRVSGTRGQDARGQVAGARGDRAVGDRGSSGRAGSARTDSARTGSGRTGSGRVAAGVRGTAGAGAPSGTGSRPSSWRHLRVVGQTAAQPFATSPGSSRTGVSGAGALPVRAARLRSPAAAVPLPRISFVLLVLVLLAGGLVSLLVVNTTLGASSFRISQLQSDKANLSLQEQTLLGQIAKERSPQGVEERAYQLGMRMPASSNILDLRNHRYARVPSHAGALGQDSTAARRTARHKVTAHPGRAAHAARGATVGRAAHPKRVAASPRTSAGSSQ